MPFSTDINEILIIDKKEGKAKGVCKAKNFKKQFEEGIKTILE